MLRALGVVQGLSEIATASGYPPASVLLRCTSALLKEVRGEGGGEDAAIHKMVEAAAALILYNRDSAMWTHSVGLIARVPTAYFSPEVVHASVAIWHWLIVADAQRVGAHLVEEVVDAWLWTQREGQGLFADVALTPASALGLERDLTVAAITAHNIWIVFFAETWQVVKHGIASLPPTYVASLWRLVSGSLEDAARPLSMYPGACSARFRLLRLALDFCCHCTAAGVMEPTAGSQLYAAVLAAAFAWFEAPEAWFNASKVAGREAAASVADFHTAVNATRGAAGVLAARPGSDVRLLGLDAKLTLLTFLLDAERGRLVVWADPLEATVASPNGLPPQLSEAQWQQFVATAWGISPALALQLHVSRVANCGVDNCDTMEVVDVS
jgi:hypothetical protein